MATYSTMEVKTRQMRAQHMVTGEDCLLLEVAPPCTPLVLGGMPECSP